MKYSSWSFIFVLLLSNICFGRAIPRQNYQKPTIVFYPDDVTSFYSGALAQDEDGDTYLEYPKYCLSENSDAYTKLKQFVQNFYSYTEKTYVLLEKACRNTRVGHLSQTDIDFDVSLFPDDTKLEYEIFYFSDQLPEQFLYGSKIDGRGYGLGEFIEYGKGNYRIFTNTADDKIKLLNQVGLKATLSKDNPIGIGETYFAEYMTSDYEKAYLKSLSNASKVNVNADVGRFKIKDYITDTKNPISIKQFRNPFLASNNFGVINTVFWTRILVSEYQVSGVCSKYSKEYLVAKTRVEEDKEYSQFIDKLAQNNSSNILTTILSYYYESQKNIDSAITFVKANFSNTGIEKELLIETLNGLSVLKGNNCLNQLTLEQLRSDKNSSLRTISQCYQSGKITSVQKSLVDQLVQLDSNSSNLSNEFQNEIKSMASKEASKKVRLLTIKNKIKKFFNGMPSFYLKDACSKGLGYSNQSEMLK